MYRTDVGTLWEKARVGWSERTTLKHVYYQVWNRSPAQVGCMRQVLRAGSLGWPGGMGWGTHINPWLIHVSVWQKPLQYCKVISLQLININEKIKKRLFSSSPLSTIRVVISAYLKLLIFLLTILISACYSSSPAFLMLYSAYKLNKQGDNIQPWSTPFPIWNQSVVPCPVLTVASWPAYRFLKR